MSAPAQRVRARGVPWLSGPCNECEELVSAALRPGAVACPSCAQEVRIEADTLRLERCPLCGCSRFYRQKDFPPVVGIALVAVGAVLVPFTYGISLVVMAAVDLLVYRLVPVMAVCYLCRAELRGVPVPERVLPFRHHMAEGYEKRRERAAGERTARRRAAPHRSGGARSGRAREAGEAGAAGNGEPDQSRVQPAD